jgi:hypothetical protein
MHCRKRRLRVRRGRVPLIENTIDCCSAAALYPTVGFAGVPSAKFSTGKSSKKHRKWMIRVAEQRSTRMAESELRETRVSLRGGIELRAMRGHSSAQTTVMLGRSHMQEVDRPYIPKNLGYVSRVFILISRTSCRIRRRMVRSRRVS